MAERVERPMLFPECAVEARVEQGGERVLGDREIAINLLQHMEDDNVCCDPEGEGEGEGEPHSLR